MDNLAVYSDRGTVAHYAAASELLPPERYVFAKYVRPGMAILDVGVGGGRTSEFLAPGAARYLGLDYSDAMVAACRERFPELDFIVADASDLHMIADESYDFVIFSFNGIDTLPTDEMRRKALSELRRVAKRDGTVVISSHSAKQIVMLPNYEGADPVRRMWRTARAVARSFPRAWRALTSTAYWNGGGYHTDPVHGGLHMHVSTRASIAADCTAAGLEIVEAVGAFAPRKVPEWANNWTTYVLRRSTAA